MEFGLSVATALPPDTVQDNRSAFDYALRTCQVAYDSGFNGFGIGQRYIGGATHQYLPPLIMAGHLFARFPGVYVSTNVYLLPYGNPVRIAEEVAALDLMAPGRFLFGIGQGYRRDEGAVFGVTGRDRGRRLTEALAAMRSLWQAGPRSFSGEFWNFEDITLSIKPALASGPPVMMGADTLDALAKIPSRGGDVWYSSPRHSVEFLRRAVPVWRRVLAEAGRRVVGPAMGRNVCVAEDRRAATSLAQGPFGNYMRSQAGWGQPGERYDLPPDELIRERVILGSAEEVAEQIISLHQEFGVEYMNLRVYASGMEQERALDIVRQIGQEVLPLVRAETGASSLFSDWPASVTEKPAAKAAAVNSSTEKTGD